MSSFLNDHEVIDRVYYASYSSAQGEVFIASSDRAIVFLAFQIPDIDHTRELSLLFPESALVASEHRLHLVAFDALKNKGDQRSIPLFTTGTAFQKSVWLELLHIPYGERRTYAQIAQNIGRPHAYRAVGTAVGANRIAVLIPCHRVVPADGSIGQYRWGSAIKSQLLSKESSSGV
ncbi:methylated-DNA--[protein]-cysteine S-methyltransferase [Patescibacteria group bacterium]|nr:methylated-DNA--[protein]-cysteine S-methyltransferase [Patescibacteria group bacterium]